jgi:hypothetical protein
VRADDSPERVTFVNEGELLRVNLRI